MSKIKSAPLRIGLCVALVVLLTVCLSAGIVWATISITKEFSPTGDVPTAKLSSEIWTSTSQTAASLTSVTGLTAHSTHGAIANGSSVYLSATKTNGTVAIGVPCVLRVYATGTGFTVNTDNFTLQDNGWYYCNYLVGTNLTFYKFAQTTAAYSGYLMAELMQYTSKQNEGFVKYWAPLAGRNASSAVLSNSKTGATIDGLSLNATLTDASAHFAAFNKKGTGRTQYAALADQTTVTKAGSLIAPIPAGTYAQDATANLTITSLTGSNLVIYNNSSVPMVFTVKYTFATYTKSGDNYTIASGNTDFSVTAYTAGTGWTAAGTDNYIYNHVVQPGGYIDALSSGITIKFNNANYATTALSGDYAIRVAATITAEDVESMYTKSNSSESSYAAYDVYAGNCPASKYLTWINNFNAENSNNKINYNPLATTVSTKMVSNEENTTSDDSGGTASA